MSDASANIAIVTDGSSGIGARICRQMLDAGDEVISLARRFVTGQTLFVCGGASIGSIVI